MILAFVANHTMHIVLCIVYLGVQYTLSNIGKYDIPVRNISDKIYHNNHL
ncbi:hypothetical protein ABIB62_000052 [Mucilaginibacter sp. UYP25]